MVDLIYARPGAKGVELCIQDSIGYRVYPLPHDKAFRLARQIMDMVTFPAATTDNDTVIYESNLGWIDGHD
tara:strand:+ start:1226 stop:1438 length:213 start_codon:yes stop_codon:yes gene_type:complete